MTGLDWQSVVDPAVALDLLSGKVSDRKLRLFAAACFSRLVDLLPDPRQRRGIEALEQLAEGALTMLSDECRRVATEVRHAIPPDDCPSGSWVAGMPPVDHRHYVALMLYREFRSRSIAGHAVQAAGGRADGKREGQEQLRLMRCIFGDTFRPATVKSQWLTPPVLSLAGSIEVDRDFDRLPALADALEGVGCDDVEVLTHCRGGGPHAKGCWVVDAILGKS